MKYVFLILAFCSIVFAGNILVKDSQSSISINGILYDLEKDTTKEFVDGSTICYEDGNGRVIINDSIQLSNIEECIQTTIKDDSVINNLLEGLKDSILISFSDTNEKIVDGVSSKDVNFENQIETISIEDEQQYIVVQSESSGPLPITLEIKNDKGTTIKKLINNENTQTAFILNTNYMGSNYELTLSNGFGINIKNIRISKKQSFLMK